MLIFCRFYTGSDMPGFFTLTLTILANQILDTFPYFFVFFCFFCSSFQKYGAERFIFPLFRLFSQTKTGSGPESVSIR